MRVTIEDLGKEAAEILSLEGEAAAWRSKRAGRPASVAEKMPVVRIRRRARAASCTASSADRPLAGAALATPDSGAPDGMHAESRREEIEGRRAALGRGSD